MFNFVKKKCVCRQSGVLPFNMSIIAHSGKGRKTAFSASFLSEERGGAFISSRRVDQIDVRCWGSSREAPGGSSRGEKCAKTTKTTAFCKAELAKPTFMLTVSES